MSVLGIGRRVVYSTSVGQPSRSAIIACKRVGFGVVVIVGLYALLPLAIFNFREVASPYDEDTYEGREVAIGPKPHWWVPKAACKLDIPGGFSYEEGGWPFVVWKPVCITFIQSKGYALPAAWRR